MKTGRHRPASGVGFEAAGAVAKAKACLGFRVEERNPVGEIPEQ